MATSTPSLLKVAVLKVDEIRTSISGCAIANRCKRGASHFAVEPGGELTISTRSLRIASSMVTVFRICMSATYRPG
jgi:hypothetical protein